jgi:hypothetical protein
MPVFTFTAEQVKALNEFHTSFPTEGSREIAYTFIGDMFRNTFSNARDAISCYPMWDDVWVKLEDLRNEKLNESQRMNIANKIMYFYAFPGQGRVGMYYYKRLEDDSIVKDKERNRKEGFLSRYEIVELVKENEALKQKLDFIAEIL